MIKLKPIIENIIRKSIINESAQKVNAKTFFKYVDSLIIKFKLVVKIGGTGNKIDIRLDPPDDKTKKKLHSYIQSKFPSNKFINDQIQNLWVTYSSNQFILSANVSPYSDEWLMITNIDNIIDLYKNASKLTTNKSIESLFTNFLRKYKSEIIPFVIKNPTKLEVRKSENSPEYFIYFRYDDDYIFANVYLDNRIGSYKSSSIITKDFYDKDEKLNNFKDGSLLSKEILKALKSKGEDISKFLKGGKIQSKKQELLKQILSDFKSFRPDGQSGDPEIEGSFLTSQFRHLGNWVHDEEDAYYRSKDDPTLARRR